MHDQIASQKSAATHVQTEQIAHVKTTKSIFQIASQKLSFRNLHCHVETTKFMSQVALKNRQVHVPDCLANIGKPMSQIASQNRHVKTTKSMSQIASHEHAHPNWQVHVPDLRLVL